MSTQGMQANNHLNELERLNNSFSTQVSDKEPNKLIKTTNHKDLSNMPNNMKTTPEMLYENKKRPKNTLEDISTEEISDGFMKEKNNYSKSLQNNFNKSKPKSQPKYQTNFNTLSLKISEKDEKIMKAREKREKQDEDKRKFLKEKTSLPAELRIEKTPRFDAGHFP